MVTYPVLKNKIICRRQAINPGLLNLSKTECGNFHNGNFSLV